MNINVIWTTETSSPAFQNYVREQIVEGLRRRVRGHRVGGPVAELYNQRTTAIRLTFQLDASSLGWRSHKLHPIWVEHNAGEISA